MSENKTSVDRTSFIFGLVAGIAVISVIVLLNQNFNDENISQVAGEVMKNDAQVVIPSDNNPSDNNPSASPVKPISDSDYVRGNKNAKVSIIEYSDFECPFSSRHQETMLKIAEDFGNQVAITFRHFPLSFHQEAQKAAEATECAGEQGKFWEMHDKIFEANVAGTMSISLWKEYAKNLGLNSNKFNTCLDDGQYAGKIRQDMAEGSAAGVQGTPATFINGQMISGAVPYEQIKSLIEQAL